MALSSGGVATTARGKLKWHQTRKKRFFLHRGLRGSLMLADDLSLSGVSLSDPTISNYRGEACDKGRHFSNHGRSRILKARAAEKR
jgi:hypothetical protein